MRSRLVVAAVGSGAVLCASAAYYVRLKLADVPFTPPNAKQLYHKSIPQTEKEHILDGQFTVVATTEAMPARLREAFTVISRERFAMHNPGWSSGMLHPMPSSAPVPVQRLLFAGLANNKWFIHYQPYWGCGPTGNYYVVVFDIDEQNRVGFLWGGAGPEAAGDLDDLRRRIAAGQFTDNLFCDW
jgi:hypothetical protein